MRDLYSLARRGSFYILAGKLVMSVIGFLATVFIVRTLSVRDYGIYNVLLAALSYIGLFSSLGLPSIFQRYLPEFSEKKQIPVLKKLVMKGLKWRFLLGAALVVVIILFSGFIGRIIRVTGFFNYFTIFSVAIIFFLEVQLLSIALTSLFRYKEFVVSELIFTLFRGAFLYLLLRLGAGLIGLLVAEGLAYGLQFFLQAVYYRQFSHSHAERVGGELPTRRLLRFGGYSYFNEMGSEILNVSTDFFVISAFLGPQFVGLYAFANRVATYSTRLLPHNLLMDVVRPTFFARYAQSGKKKDLVTMFNLTTKLIAFISFPLVAGIFVLGDKLIIHLFDPKYLSGLWVLWIVTLFTALNSFQFPLGLVTQSVERVEINFYSKIFAVYNLILDLIVVKPFGIIGVALATSSAILFKNLFILVFARRYVQLTVDWKALGKIALNSALMGLMVYPLRGLVTSLWSFLLVVAFGFLAYMFIAYLNKGFSETDRVILNKILPRSVFVF